MRCDSPPEKVSGWRFPTGERRGEPVEGEVVEADGIEEFETLADFVQDAAGNLFLHGRERERGEERGGGADGEGRGLADVFGAVLFAEADGASFSAEALGLAVGAERVAAVFRQHHADVQLVLFALEEREEAMDADKRAASVEGEGLLFGRRVPAGDVDANAVLLCGAAEFGEERAVLGAIPRIDGALVERLRLVGNDEVEVEVDGVAEALATGARAVGVVKREEARLRLAVLAVTGFAFEGGGEPETFGSAVVSHISETRGDVGHPAEAFQNHRVLRFAQDDRRVLIAAANDLVQNFAGFAVADFGGVDDAGSRIGGDRDAVHEDVNRQREVDFEQRFGRRKLVDGPVLIKAVETTLAQIEEAFAERVGNGAGTFCSLRFGRFFGATRSLCRFGRVRFRLGGGGRPRAGGGGGGGGGTPAAGAAG